MRDFLTGLAIVLIIVLSTVLVAPYFVDWTGQRSFLEARLSHALGQKVTIGGNIDLKLLPTPYLVLDQVVVGSDDGPVRVGVHHLDLELTVAPLLHGEFDVTEARLEEPNIRLSLAPGRTLPKLPAAPAFQADIRFDKIHVVDGTLAITDPETGRTYLVDHLDLDADAESLTGPFKVEGSGGPPAQRTRFHLATAPPEAGRTHTRLVIEETAAHPAIELDGALALTNSGSDAVRQSFIGKLVTSGHLPQIDDTAAPWKLSGVLQTDPDRATLANGELRLGGEDAALTLQADATGTFGDTGQVTLNLSAKQLDVDRLVGPPSDTPRPPPRVPDVANLRRLLAATKLPVPWTLDLSIDKATWGGDTLSNIEANAGFGQGVSNPLKLDVDGPGDSHLALDGTVTGGATPAYDGKLSFIAADTHRATVWMATVAPADSAAANVKTDLRRMDVRSHVTVDAHRVSGKDFVGRFDETDVKGSGALDYGDATHVAKLTADLAAQKLDLDTLPAIANARTLATPLDLDLKLDAGLVGGGRLLGPKAGNGGHLIARVTKTGDRVSLRDVRLDKLGGATLGGSATFDPHQASFDANVEAQDLDGLATLLRSGLPGPTIESLAARADTLVPAKTKIAATLTGEGGTFTLSALSLSGTFGATRIDAKMPPTKPGKAATLALALAAPESGPLLHQLGFDTLPIDTIGAGRITINAKRAENGAFDTRLAGTLGQSDIRLDGRFSMGSGRPEGSGRLTLSSADVGPLFQTLAFAFPDMTGRIPAELSGNVSLTASDVHVTEATGRVAGVAAKGDLGWKLDAGDAPQLTGHLDIAHVTTAGLFGLMLGPGHEASDGPWSREAFGDGLVDPPQMALHLSIGTLELSDGIAAQNAAFDLGIEPGVLRLSQIAAHVAGGTLEGGLTLRRDGKQAALEGKLSVDGVQLRLPVLEANVSGALDIAGGGTSAAALAASLAGTGSANATAIAVPGADASAIRRVFDDVEADTLSVDEEAIVRAWSEAAKAPLRLPDRKLDLDLAAGVLHANSGDAVPPDAPVNGTLDVGYDISSDRLALGVKETLNALPKNWSGPQPSITVNFQGSPRETKRTVDVGNFLNAVAARALARETARIEAYEFDIRERAFFNTRLQTDQRRMAERQKAEDDARKAEAERKARLEATRLERQRKEQAVKAARDAAKARDLDTPAPEGNGTAPPQSPQPPAGADPSTLGRY